MPPNNLPPEMVNYFNKKQKPRIRRKMPVFVVILLIGVLVLVAFFLLPTFSAFLSAGESGTVADPSLKAAAPSAFTMGSILGSIGLNDMAQDLQVADFSLHSGASSWVTGRIRNTGNQTYQGFTIYYDLYDANGNAIGSVYALMSDLAPGQEKDFKTSALNQNAASAKLKYLMGGNLEASGTIAQDAASRK